MPTFVLPACLCKQQPAAEIGKAGGCGIQNVYGKICRVLLNHTFMQTYRNTPRKYKILLVRLFSFPYQKASIFCMALFAFLNFLIFIFFYFLVNSAF